MSQQPVTRNDEYARIVKEIDDLYTRNLNYGIGTQDTPRETLLLLQSVLDLVEEQDLRINELTQSLVQVTASLDRITK